jgi:hypothetical protein
MLTRANAAAAAAIAALTLALPGTASAAGDAPAARGTMQFDCAGLGAVTIVTPPAAAHENWSAAQIATGGHLVPVAFAYVVYDDTAGVTLDDETVTHAAAHTHQPTTSCVFSQTAVLGDIAPPDIPVPQGVAPSDTVTSSVIVTAIIKP